VFKHLQVFKPQQLLEALLVCWPIAFCSKQCRELHIPVSWPALMLACSEQLLLKSQL